MAGSEYDKEPLYEPLHTIRLLRLLWGRDKSNFDGYLVSFALNSVTCPDFVALSYTWGTPPLQYKSININGHDHDVLDNLYPFLKLAPELKGFSSDTWWWIDSICINQKDEKEKSSQMAIMGSIYERAAETVVWLGEEIDERFSLHSRDCSDAIDTMYRICHEMDAATIEERSQGKTVYSLDKAQLTPLGLPERGVNWAAVERLLLRPWWRRVWTLQEFLISNHLRFYCGKKNISRQRLHRAIYGTWVCLRTIGERMSRTAFHAGWNRRRINQWYEEPKLKMGLVAMLAYVGDCGATDERDRIYSLLGVAKDFEMVPHRDSTSSTEDLYQALVAAFIDRYKSLDIICYAHIFNSSGVSGKAMHTRRLPSWVPDWRARVEGKVIPVMASQGSMEGTGNFRPEWVRTSSAKYRASANEAPPLKESKNPNILICSGIVIDRIDGLGGMTHDDLGRVIDVKRQIDFSNIRSTQEHEILSGTTTLELVEILSRCMALDREDRYFADSMTPRLFRDDFQTFCSTALNRPASVPKLFRDWFSLNKSFQISGQTLEEHCRKQPQPENLPSRAKFQHGSLKHFFERFQDTIAYKSRRLTITEHGHLGMAPCRAVKGDLVCVLIGCSIPVVLRENEDRTYEFIGECYLDGFMNGEAVDQNLPRNEIRLV